MLYGQSLRRGYEILAWCCKASNREQQLPSLQEPSCSIGDTSPLTVTGTVCLLGSSSSGQTEPMTVSGDVPALEQLSSLSEGNCCSLIGALQHQANIL